MISNPNYESHKDELELLQNILFEQITVTEDTPNYIFDIEIKADDEKAKLDVSFTINLPNEYPNVHPIFEIVDKSSIIPSWKIKSLNEKIREFAEENLGFPMIYQMYEVVKDFVNDQEQVLNNESISRLTLEEDAKKSYNNKIKSFDKELIETKTFTPVNKDNFEIWFKKFYSDKQKGRVKNPEMDQRMTGREYFMNLKNLKPGELEEGEDDEDAEASSSTNVAEEKNTICFDTGAFEEIIDDIDFDNDEEIDIDDI